MQIATAVRADEDGPLQPDVLDARAAVRQVALDVVHDVLAAAQQQHRQHGHHGDQADKQAAAADDPHLLDALKLVKAMARKAPAVVKAPVKMPCPV